MGDIESDIKKLADKVKDHAGSMQTEEAVKTAVVMPFLRSLGYDVFDPYEVIPEFTADAVGKKGEKVDYAIAVDGVIRILVECKPVSTGLDKRHLDQLFRYFTVTPAKFAILTNGRQFNFYTDLDEANKLDTRPFLSFDITDMPPGIISEIKKFEKANFDVSNILATAERLKYTSAMRRVISDLIDNPSEDFVRLVAGQVYEGRMTASAKDMLSGIVRTAFREVIHDEVRKRLANALAGAEKQTEELPQAPQEQEEIVTTQEEIEGFLTVKAVVRGTIDTQRIIMRDAKSYCAVLVDDNNRRPLARLHFNRGTKYLGLFDGEVEEKVAINKLDDIYEYADRIIATAKKYATQK